MKNTTLAIKEFKTKKIKGHENKTVQINGDSRLIVRMQSVDNESSR
jgi:hypothetical protein